MIRRAGIGCCSGSAALLPEAELGDVAVDLFEFAAELGDATVDVVDGDSSGLAADGPGIEIEPALDLSR
jgi:hypothetical protein